MHTSWKILEPKEEDRYFAFNTYYTKVQNIKGYKHIPKLVFEQWIYPHHQESNTVKNYSWLDFNKISFNLVSWSTSQVLQANVIDNFKNFFSEESMCSSFKDFRCLPKDLDYWKKHGTWRIPPELSVVFLNNKRLLS
jgi:hypothetical protein